MKNILILTIVSLVMGPIGACAQAPAAVSEKDFATELDAYIRKTMEAVPELPSIAMVVVKDDKPIFMRAYGLANKEKGTKADANTLYYIASSTKSYTALAAAMLDREGKIKLSDPVVKYAPGVVFRTPIPEKVTVRDLLTHTSGLTNDPFAWRVAYSGEVDDKDLLSVFANGTTFDEKSYGKYAYTNLGYNIYGELAQLSLNKRWQDLLQEKVFDPTGMKQTTAYVSRARSKKLTAADSYLFDPEKEAVVRSPLDKLDNNMQAAGGIFTSLNDLARWLTINMNDGKIDGKQVIPVDVMRTVHTGYTDTVRTGQPFTGGGKYGLGWQIGQYKNEAVIYHFGGFPGWSSHISYMPEKKIGVAVMINESTAGGQIGSLLATYAYDRLLGKETNENYEKQLVAMAQLYGKFKQQMVESFKSRASRTSQLTHPLTDYTGRYTSELMGNMNISIEQNALAVRIGNIHVVSTPFTDKDTIRVEMVPGQGEIIQFHLNDTGRVDSLVYAGMKFTKAL
jgi:CubicO group peptidase (beta-lactamase class C family)